MEELHYKGSWFQYKDELRRLDQLLQIRYLHFKEYSTNQQEQFFRGLYISDEEFQDLLFSDTGQTSQLQDGSLETQAVSRYRKIGKKIERRLQASRQAGVDLSPVLLRERFALSELDHLILMAALAPDLHLKYERVYAYLQDDVTRKRPTIQFIADLLTPFIPQEQLLKEHLCTKGPLLHHHLLELQTDSSSGVCSHLGNLLTIPDRIRRYLLFFDQKPADELDGLEIHDSLEDELHSSELRERAERFLASHEQNNKLLFLLAGEQEWEQKPFSSFLAARMGKKLLCMKPGSGDRAGFLNTVWPLLIREAILQSGCLYLDLSDLDGDQSGERDFFSIFLKRLAVSRVPIFLHLRHIPGAAFALEDVDTVPITFSPLNYKARRLLWKTTLQKRYPELVSEADWLATKFRYTPRQVQGTVKALDSLVHWHSEERESLIHHLHQACRWQTDHNLGSLARKIEPRFHWSQLILLEDRKEQLREICDLYSHRSVVYGEWNVGNTMSRGKGLVALFCGPSGTGKTMAAEIMAATLNLELYTINISSMVSKYIGETEKNLERIFREAEKTDVLLFFDEAESLFGKRSEVKDAHDRYANVEVSYLLQRIEEYDGMVILASNLKKNIDDAFIRRMNTIIDFPFPDEADRLRLWDTVFPPKVPLDPNLDFKFIADKFKLSGGNISNIAMRSLFFAARDNTAVQMKHIFLATKREFQKMGKLIMESDFRLYPVSQVQQNIKEVGGS